ncbi:MAG: molybdate ABC transporter permease subunit [Cyanobacteriota bacterium]
MEFDLSPLWISIKTALVATIFAFWLGIAVARWMFEYQGKGKGIIDGILTLTLVLPPTVVGFLLLLLLGRNSPVGQLLLQLGLNIIFTWPATVIAASVVAFPLMYKAVLGAFEQVDRDFINCARTLGASELKIFWQIILPLAWPGVIAGTILAFARALGEFGATLMLAGSIPGKTQTMPIAIFFAAEAGNMRVAMIWVLIMVAISLIVIAAINSWSESQSSKKIVTRKASTFTKKLLNFLILGQFHDIEITQANSVGQARYSNQRSQPQRQATELLVNLQKSLPDFPLNVNFKADGNPLGLLGASGSGKSMTLRCIAGLETPTQGRIVLNGRVLFDAKRGINIPSRKRRIGVVFQNYALFPHLTIAQNIAFGLQELPKIERTEAVAKYINMMQLQGMENRYPHQISGGQQQRVALARALAVAPEALLLDEPLSALDTYLRSQIEKLLTKVLCNYEGVTLFITHKLEEAYRLCSDLLVLSQGKVIASGSKADIFERPPNVTVAQITECKNFSRAQMIDAQHIKALDWDCTLEVVEAIADSLAYVGIRAHHIKFLDNPHQENTFLCWVTQTSETQHRMTVYLKLHSPPTDSEEYDLQVEVYKEKWEIFKDRPFPWYVRLDPLRLMLMTQ